MLKGRGRKGTGKCAVLRRKRILHGRGGTNRTEEGIDTALGREKGHATSAGGVPEDLIMKMNITHPPDIGKIEVIPKLGTRVDIDIGGLATATMILPTDTEATGAVLHPLDTRAGNRSKPS
jgi:hypothetical protein